MRTKLVHAAWMAIVLGFVMELIVLAAGASKSALVRDTLAKISWSTVVCFGVALGATASAKLRAGAMGIAGFFAAPAGFAVARIVQKALSQAASSASSESLIGVVLLASLKALEYGGFGLVTGWMSSDGMNRAGHYVTAGAVTGLYFGSLITAVLIAGTAARVLPLALNEILFPIGCAMVLFVSGLLARSD